MQHTNFVVIWKKRFQFKYTLPTRLKIDSPARAEYKILLTCYVYMKRSESTIFWLWSSILTTLKIYFREIKTRRKELKTLDERQILSRYKNEFHQNETSTWRKWEYDSQGWQPRIQYSDLCIPSITVSENFKTIKRWSIKWHWETCWKSWYQEPWYAENVSRLSGGAVVNCMFKYDKTAKLDTSERWCGRRYTERSLLPWITESVLWPYN